MAWLLMTPPPFISARQMKAAWILHGEYSGRLLFPLFTQVWESVPVVFN
jgi:hypothetical protein